MLILTRKIGQQVLIDNGAIQIKVLKIEGGKISIGFSAPENIDICREEVYLRKLAQEASSLYETPKPLSSQQHQLPCSTTPHRPFFTGTGLRDIFSLVPGRRKNESGYFKGA